MSEMTTKTNLKTFLSTLLNGLALGVVIVLIPGAILGELLKVLLPYWNGFGIFLQAIQMSNSMMGIIVGVIIGQLFKFNPIQIGSLALAVMFAGGAPNIDNGTLTLIGTGDIINMGLTAALGVLVIQWLSDKTKSFTLIIVPTITLLLVGGLGRTLLPYVKLVTAYIGQAIASLIGLQPFVMGFLLAIIFCMLIVSPITTVGIALTIGLSGIGSGAANLGICSAAFGLCIAGWSVNSRGVSLAHVIGSPKMSMANVLSKPIILLPMLCSAGVLGILAALFNIQGTPASAGFGISGLIGPINALNLMGGGWSAANIILIFSVFIVAPIALNIVFCHIFTKVIKLIKPSDYQLEV